MIAKNQCSSWISNYITYFNDKGIFKNCRDCFKQERKKEKYFTNEFLKNASDNTCIKKWIKSKELKPRLHLDSNCLKTKKGSKAKPDCVIINNNNEIEIIIEIKILSGKNDCDIFNGVVQLREYMDIYQVSTGVLFDVSNLEQYCNQAAEFLASLECENIKVVVANYHNNNWMVKPISEIMREDNGFLKGNNNDN